MELNLTNCGSIKVIKVDDADPATRLEGAKFDLLTNVAPLTAPPGAGDTKIAECTTDANGECLFTDILDWRVLAGRDGRSYGTRSADSAIPVGDSGDGGSDGDQDLREPTTVGRDPHHEDRQAQGGRWMIRRQESRSRSVVAWVLRLT